MRRRVRLSEEQLLKVQELRASGSSWSAAEEDLGVNRQIIKREFEDWERLHGIRDLVTVRREVAAADFGRHLDELTTLGDELADALEAMLEARWVSTDRPLFDDVLDQDRPIERSGDATEYPTFAVSGDRSPSAGRRRRLHGRLRHRRHAVFEGLESHLRTTNWSLMRGRLLKSRRDAALELVELERRAHSNGDRPTHRSGITRPLANQLLDMLWDALVELAACSEATLLLPSTPEWKQMTREVWPFTRGTALARWLNNMIQVDAHGDGFGIDTDGRFVIPRLTNKDEAEQMVNDSQLQLESLLLSEPSRRLYARLQDALQVIEPMTALLDEVRLRPLLLRTRCDLCAV